MFHCIHSEELEKNAFEVNTVEYDVPCVFQIWVKKDTERSLEPAILADGFTYVKVDKPFDIAFKRVGGQAGKCYPFITDAAAKYNYQYYYYFKLDDEYTPFTHKIIDLINAHVFPSNTVGMRSLSKTEANLVLNQILESVDS